MIKIKTKKNLHIGEIANILDWYDKEDGASANELSVLFDVSYNTIIRVVKKYGEQYKKTEFAEFLTS